jgi:anaerobic ribonucleoside-triphosphate reductase
MERTGTVDRLQRISVEIAKIEEELKQVQGTPCEIYSRVVGYHRPIQNWNKGKQEEFKERVTFRV